MKTTGVVRKIDELGRIVIPKEIRKNLKLNIGSPLEIYVDGSKIVLEKYSSLLALSEISQDCLDLIYSMYNVSCLITDNEKIIAARGLPKSMINTHLHIDSNLTYIQDHELNRTLNKQYLACIPISYESDTVGNIVLMSDKMFDFNIDSLKPLASFIAMQMR